MAERVARRAVMRRRSSGNGSKGPRTEDWALAATASPRHVLLIRRLISRPDSLTFYLCWAPEDQPATMTFFVTIAGRRWRRGNVHDREGYDQLEPDPGAHLGRDLAAHRPDRTRPAPPRRHPQRPVRRH